jgi:hypothetical protein
MKMAKLKDPVSGDKEKEVVPTLENYTLTSVKPEAAKLRRPFDGYPFKKVSIDGNKIISAFIVAIDPDVIRTRQDPSNRKKVKNYHSPTIRDYEEQDNMVVTFNREIIIKGKTYFYDVVPSHSVRAQLVFKYDPNKKRIEVVPGVLLMDDGQVGRLKQLFEQLINPKLKIEREASFIAGESHQDGGENEPLNEETGV